MNAAQVSFKTAAFVDTAEVLARNVNGIAGYELAQWLAGALRQGGCTVEAPWPEDHGWDLGFTHGDGRYLVSCSFDGEDAAREGHVVVARPRSFMDRLKGRNTMSADDRVLGLVQASLRAHPEVRDMAVHLA